MRSKYPRSSSPLISPNLNMALWAPGYGNVLEHGDGIIGIFDPKAISPSTIHANVPISLNNLFDLPTIYPDGSSRFLNISQATPTTFDWTGWKVIIVGLTRDHNPETETNTFLGTTSQINTTTEWSYITDIFVVPPSPLVTIPPTKLWFNLGFLGYSRLFFPDCKCSSWDNSLQLNFFPFTPGDPSFYIDVRGSNVPQNVIKNTAPLGGPQVDESYLKTMYDTSFIIPCDGLSVPTMATMDDISASPFVARIPFPVNCFWILLKNSDAGEVDNGITGTIIFNQTGRWFN